VAAAAIAYRLQCPRCEPAGPASALSCADSEVILLQIIDQSPQTMQHGTHAFRRCTPDLLCEICKESSTASDRVIKRNLIVAYAGTDKGLVVHQPEFKNDYRVNFVEHRSLAGTVRNGVHDGVFDHTPALMDIRSLALHKPARTSTVREPNTCAPVDAVSSATAMQEALTVMASSERAKALAASTSSV